MEVKVYYQIKKIEKMRVKHPPVVLFLSNSEKTPIDCNESIHKIILKIERHPLVSRFNKNGLKKFFNHITEEDGQ